MRFIIDLVLLAFLMEMKVIVWIVVLSLLCLLRLGNLICGKLEKGNPLKAI